MMAPATKSNPEPTLTSALLVPLLLSLAMWIVYKLDIWYNLDLYRYGVFPRSLHGLTGIVATPLIHDTRNLSHVFENTLALLFFGTLVFYFYRRIAGRVVVIAWIATQFLVWLGATANYHVGMSGVIYALAFFLITSSIIRKNKQLTAITFLIIFLYGGIFWGLLPLMPQVSWESHAFGAGVGILLGLLYRKALPNHVRIDPPIVDDPADDEPGAWWKTGVIVEPNPHEKQITVEYDYKPRQNLSPPNE